MNHTNLNLPNTKKSYSMEKNSSKKNLSNSKRSNYRKEKAYINYYEELENLPNDIDDAIKKKKNLTLYEILVLMNIHSIYLISLFDINKKIKYEKVKNMCILIKKGTKFSYVPYYNWYDLKNIELIINGMF